MTIAGETEEPMSTTLSGCDGVVEIELAGELGIERAAEIRTQLVDALVAGQSLRIGLAGVTEIDVTILQLLYAARQEAARRSLEFQLTVPIAEPVVVAISAAGLLELIPLPDAKE